MLWGAAKERGRVATLFSNSTPRYHQREMKTCMYTKKFTQIFIAASFIIAKNGNNPNIHVLINE